MKKTLILLALIGSVLLAAGCGSSSDSSANTPAPEHKGKDNPVSEPTGTAPKGDVN